LNITSLIFYIMFPLIRSYIRPRVSIEMIICKKRKKDGMGKNASLLHVSQSQLFHPLTFSHILALSVLLQLCLDW
jgi:hypothetical protein